MKLDERLRGWLKSGMFWLWSLFMIAVGALIGAVVQQWAAPALIGAFEDDPIERTEVRLFQPYEADGTPASGLVVTERVLGWCQNGASSANFRNPNAFRCFSPGRVEDPCYTPGFGQVPARGQHVLCVAAPWKREVVVLSVTRSDKVSGPSRRELDALREVASPWALELETGERCLFAVGAGEAVAGLRLNYVCYRGDVGLDVKNASGWVIGEPTRSEDVWRVQYSAEDAIEFREVRVRTAWW